MRKAQKDKAEELWKLGDIQGAVKKFSESVNITPQMAHNLIEERIMIRFK